AQKKILVGPLLTSSSRTSAAMAVAILAPPATDGSIGFAWASVRGQPGAIRRGEGQTIFFPFPLWGTIREITRCVTGFGVACGRASQRLRLDPWLNTPEKGRNMLTSWLMLGSVLIALMLSPVIGSAAPPKAGGTLRIALPGDMTFFNAHQ